ncbi:molybdopterin molybdotransferase MoeA [Kitasatospora griseola]|uniref:molybdopterin molybdotransferase MoeA n=1 Tax=Kitasatospora griseola TaxID=2064 RepID=UPI0037F2B32D
MSHGTLPERAQRLHRMPWQQARDTARAAAGRPLPAVARDLPDALGHTLAEPLTALTDLPAFDTSAMDGWAVAGPGPWRLLDGGILAGEAPAAPLDRGTALPVATGAPLPAGATAVLRYEHGGLADGVLHHLAPGRVAAGRDVRPRGQECRHGDELLPAGALVTPAVLGLAAAAGHDRLRVHRQPTVELLLLGDELLTSGVPDAGLVRDALGPLLPPMLAAAGADVIGIHRVGDDLALLVDALRDSRADVVLTTGSTAVGPADFLHRALTGTGARLLVDSVAVRPGHPMLLAELPGASRHLVGLPGNPLAAVAGTLTLALPLLHHLAGRAPLVRRFPAAALPGHPHDTRLLPVTLLAGTALPLPFDGPAMLRGLALADALAVVPPGGVAAGGTVEVLDVPGR